MKKLTKWLRVIDDNLVHIALTLFIILTSLFPKIPYQFVEYTYIRIRYDDFFPAVLVAIFVIQWLRKKIKLNTKFMVLILLFWGAVFISFVVGAYIQNTIAIQNIGLLHSLRRIQYISVFFVAASATVSDARFRSYMKTYFITLLLVCLYGFGQRFLQFPSIQSMNPAYVDGRLLTLTEHDRVNSTFGGHFDLAAYLTFSIPILIGFYFAQGKRRYVLLFLLALTLLLYTAARSSFLAYIISIFAFLILIRKFKFLLFTVFATVVLLFVTGETAERFAQTVQLKTVFVNTQTGQKQIDQRTDRVEELPAGEYEIPLLSKLKTKSNTQDPTTQREILEVARGQAITEALKQGRKVNTDEIEKRAQALSKFIQPERTVLCDISCATRLQVEWPRAVAAFMFNPFVGSGASSITEATDNNLLRLLGEFGLLGTIMFFVLLGGIAKQIYRASKVDRNRRFIYLGFVFGLFALFINAMYVDIFEASKVAYNLWIVAGMFVGISGLALNKSYEKGNKK